MDYWEYIVIAAVFMAIVFVSAGFLMGAVVHDRPETRSERQRQEREDRARQSWRRYV